MLFDEIEIHFLFNLLSYCDQKYNICNQKHISIGISIAYKICLKGANS